MTVGPFLVKTDKDPLRTCFPDVIVYLCHQWGGSGTGASNLFSRVALKRFDGRSLCANRDAETKVEWFQLAKDFTLPTISDQASKGANAESALCAMRLWFGPAREWNRLREAAEHRELDVKESIIPLESLVVIKDSYHDASYHGLQGRVRGYGAAFTYRRPIFSVDIQDARVPRSRIRVAAVDLRVQNLPSWDAPRRATPHAAECELRLFLFQAADLIPTSTSGTCDPHVQVYFRGKKTQSSTARKTLSPQWFEVLVLNVEVPIDAVTKSLAIDECPPIHLLVQDSSLYVGDTKLFFKEKQLCASAAANQAGTSHEEHEGDLEQPLASGPGWEFVWKTDASLLSRAPEPRWLNLNGCGKILASAQLVRIKKCKKSAKLKISVGECFTVQSPYSLRAGLRKQPSEEDEAACGYAYQNALVCAASPGPSQRDPTAMDRKNNTEFCYVLVAPSTFEYELKFLIGPNKMVKGENVRLPASAVTKPPIGLPTALPDGTVVEARDGRAWREGVVVKGYEQRNGGWLRSEYLQRSKLKAQVGQIYIFRSSSFNKLTRLRLRPTSSRDYRAKKGVFTTKSVVNGEQVKLLTEPVPNRGLTELFVKVRAITGDPAREGWIRYKYLHSTGEGAGGVPSIRPLTMKVEVTTLTLGLQDLIGPRGKPRRPWVGFDFGGSHVDDQSTLPRTPPSSSPSTTNPIYLTRNSCIVHIPRNPLFMGKLRIGAHEALLGGSRNPLFAMAEVRMEALVSPLLKQQPRQQMSETETKNPELVELPLGPGARPPVALGKDPRPPQMPWRISSLHFDGMDLLHPSHVYCAGGSVLVLDHSQDVENPFNALSSRVKKWSSRLYRYDWRGTKIVTERQQSDARAFAVDPGAEDMEGKTQESLFLVVPIAVAEQETVEAIQQFRMPLLQNLFDDDYDDDSAEYKSNEGEDSAQDVPALEVALTKMASVKYMALVRTPGDDEAGTESEVFLYYTNTHQKLLCRISVGAAHAGDVEADGGTVYLDAADVENSPLQVMDVGFDDPAGIAADRQGNIYLVDSSGALYRLDHKTRKMTLLSDTSLFRCPVDVAVYQPTDDMSSVVVYIADLQAGVISWSEAEDAKLVVPAGDVVAGSAARLNRPTSIAVDSNGAIFVVDDHEIKQVLPPSVQESVMEQILQKTLSVHDDHTNEVDEDEADQGDAPDDDADQVLHNIAKSIGRKSYLKGRAEAKRLVPGTTDKYEDVPLEESDLWTAPPFFQTHELFRFRERSLGFGLRRRLRERTVAPLRLQQALEGNFASQPLRKSVGRWKGRISVRLLQNEEAAPAPHMEQELLKPRDVVVRVYVLQGKRLRPRIGRRKQKLVYGKRDSYLVLRLGDQTLSDADDERYLVKNSLNPFFYRAFEFKNVRMPGDTTLRVSVMDKPKKDLIGRIGQLFKGKKDEEVGSTRIDLADRWFSEEWRAMGLQEETDKRYRPKPTESRPLFSPLCPDDEEQGYLVMWVDILTTENAALYPLVDIALPPKAGFELQAIVWRCQELPATSKMLGSKTEDSDLSDYYVKVGVSNGGDVIEETDFMGGYAYEDEEDNKQALEQLAAEEKKMNIFKRLKRKLRKKKMKKPPPLTYTSDVHWRAKVGFASWNYRFKIPLMLPRPRLWSALNLSVWDKHALRRDRVVGEVRSYSNSLILVMIRSVLLQILNYSI